MIRCKRDNVEWLEFEQLQGFPELVHGVFLRHGGVSSAPYHSLNCGGGSGDDPQVIEKNRNIVQTVLGIEKLVSVNQVHGDRIADINDKAIDLNEGWDGLITFEKNVGLLIKHADCQAAIIYDPIKKVIANIHCGWRGSVQNIYSRAVSELVQKYGSHPSNLLVCISPSLGPEKAEFINHPIELPSAFSPYQIRENYFDFWLISKIQLKSAGVLDHHIEIAQICTFAKGEDFFSYRRDKKTGRHGTVIALKR